MRMELARVLKELLVKNVLSVVLNTQVEFITPVGIYNYICKSIQHR